MLNIDTEDNNFGPFEDLETQQYNRLYNAFDVPLLDVRKQHFSAFIVTGLLIFILIIVLAVSLKIPNYLKIPIAVENVEKDMVIMFNHSIKVDQFFAMVGDSIAKNQRICKINSPEIKTIISEIQSSRSRLMVLKSFDTIDIALRINNLDSEINNKKNLLGTLALERSASYELFLSKKSALTSEVDYFEKFEQANKKLWDSGVISRFDYMKIKQNLINKTEELTSLLKDFNQKTQQFNFKEQEIYSNLNEISNQQIEISTSFQNEGSKLEEQIELALQKLKLFYGDYIIEDEGLVLLSSKPGLLTFCYPTKQLLKTGEMLYRFETSKGSFEGNGFVSADRIGYLKDSLHTKIMLTTFPHYEWGTLEGVLTNISRSPNEHGLYSFIIKVTGENPKIFPLLQNGQTGNCYILVEEKTLFGYLRRGVNKTVDNVMN